MNNNNLNAKDIMADAEDLDNVDFDAAEEENGDSGSD